MIEYAIQWDRMNSKFEAKKSIITNEKYNELVAVCILTRFIIPKNRNGKRFTLSVK